MMSFQGLVTEQGVLAYAFLTTEAYAGLFRQFQYMIEAAFEMPKLSSPVSSESGSGSNGSFYSVTSGP